MHVQKHILQVTSQRKPATCPSSVSDTSYRPYCWQWPKLIFKKKKKFIRHNWVMQFRGCSTLKLRVRVRVFWSYTISADCALCTTKSYKKPLSCETCTMYLNRLDFPRSVHFFLYGKKASSNTTQSYSSAWYGLLHLSYLHHRLFEVKN